MTSIMTAYAGLLTLATHGPEITAGQIDANSADPAAVIGHGYRLTRSIDVPDGHASTTAAAVQQNVVALAGGGLLLTSILAWTGPTGPHQSLAHYVLSDDDAHALAREADEEAETAEQEAGVDTEQPGIEGLGDIVVGLFGAFAGVAAPSGVTGTWDQQYPGFAGGEIDAAAERDDVEEAAYYHGQVIRGVAPTYPPLCTLSDYNGGEVATFELPTLFHWLSEQREVPMAA